jgi:hypothetical protein
VKWIGTTSLTQYWMRYAKGFQKSGSCSSLKASFSKNSPAEIEYIVIISDIAKLSWVFEVKLELPPLTAEHSDVLEIAREALQAFRTSEISEMMSADYARAIRILVRGFLQAGQSKSSKWETWLPTTWDCRPLLGRLCGNEEFESSSTEAGSEGSGWLEIFVHGKLGKNNAGRLADTLQARAPPLLPVAIWTLTRIECAQSLELQSFRQA